MSNAIKTRINVRRRRIATGLYGSSTIDKAVKSLKHKACYTLWEVTEAKMFGTGYCIIIGRGCFPQYAEL